MSRLAAIEEAAVWWLMRRGEPDWSMADQEALDCWIDEDLAHAAAFWRLEIGDLELNGLRGVAGREYTSSLRSTNWRRALASGMLAAALIGTIAGSYFLLGETHHIRPKTLQYATEIGQVAKIDLEDGTSVSLDTDSRIRVARFTNERSLWVDQGRVYLEVVANTDTPFKVYAGNGEVTVVGTKFIVARSDTKTTVSVLEGRVKLAKAGNAKAGYLTLNPGSVGDANPDALVLAGKDIESLKDEIAWQNGQVIFRDATLLEAVSAFNKYNDRKMVLLSDHVKSIRIGGSFHLGNVSGFARILRDVYGLDVEISDAQINIR